MKSLKKLVDTPIVGPAAKLALDYLVNREINKITSHFGKYLKPELALDELKKRHVYGIRHQVYCEELNFEPIRPDKQEKDEVDDYSIHCLIKHVSTSSYAGTVRIVRPTQPGELLPIEKYCLDSITNDALNPSKFDRTQICEISRLAVPEQFRRRRNDKFKGAATGVINKEGEAVVTKDSFSDMDLRCFPFIAIGLYLTAASVVILKEIEHTYVMMEPRLARSMGFVGIKFEQIGPVVEYHGKRAPYYINPRLFIKNLSPAFKTMLGSIEAKVYEEYMR